MDARKSLDEALKLAPELKQKLLDAMDNLDYVVKMAGCFVDWPGWGDWEGPLGHNPEKPTIIVPEAVYPVLALMFQHMFAEIADHLPKIGEPHAAMYNGINIESPVTFGFRPRDPANSG